MAAAISQASHSTDLTTAQAIELAELMISIAKVSPTLLHVPIVTT
jgi:hypothetical protein